MRSMERSLPNDHSSDNNKISTGDINLCSFERFVMFQLGQSVRQTGELSLELILGTQCVSKIINLKVMLQGTIHNNDF